MHCIVEQTWRFPAVLACFATGRWLIPGQWPWGTLVETIGCHIKLIETEMGRRLCARRPRIWLDKPIGGEAGHA